MQRRKFLLDQLRRYSTLAELRRSAFYAECSSEVESLLITPEVVPCDDAAPRLSAFLRVAQWNVEKGRQFDAILLQFQQDEVLRRADVVILNEADCGMNRSGNRHVALDLARALGMNLAFAPACLELTKGVGEELSLPGENRDSMQGNAVLSRYPITAARCVRLPQCFEPYEYSEKRYGGRSCLWVQLACGRGRLWVGSTHLEVRNTPACRATQMRHLLATLPAGHGTPFLLGGDFNTNTFRRGTLCRTLSASASLIWNHPDRMRERLLRPDRTEPLFEVGSRAGFSLRGFNSGEATACASLAGLEDAVMVPAMIARYIRRRLAPYQGCLCLKLDWFLGRDIRGLDEKEIIDAATGVMSMKPGCRQTPWAGPDRISDHNPIIVDLRFHEDL
jgi:endonuclease/exonuclease/phosphatase family metal-dependent hydrolase